VIARRATPRSQGADIAYKVFDAGIRGPSLRPDVIVCGESSRAATPITHTCCMIPNVEWARSRDASLAYQVLGNGDRDFIVLFSRVFRTLRYSGTCPRTWTM
jgi:hypothetical protein